MMQEEAATGPRLGKLHLTTRGLLHAIDASRALLSFLLTGLSLALNVLLFVHATPMGALPGVMIPMQLFAGVVAFFTARDLVPRQVSTPLGRFLDAASAVFAPFAAAVGWAALKVSPGPAFADAIADPSHTEDSCDVIPSLVPCDAQGVGAAGVAGTGAPGAANACPLAAREGSRSAAHAVFSSWWTRTALAAAVLEDTPRRAVQLFSAHAAMLGNGVIVLGTIALAAPAESTEMPSYVRFIGFGAVASAVLYQLVVFVPGTFARPPGIGPFFLVCFVHDVATMVGGLSSLGTCTGDLCVQLDGGSYSYAASWPSIVVLLSAVGVMPVFAIAVALGLAIDISREGADRDSWASMLIHILIISPLVFVSSVAPGAIISAGVAVVLSVPCLTIVAAVIAGLAPRHPAAALEQTLLHVFCAEVGEAFERAAAFIRAHGNRAEEVHLPPLCASSVVCHGPTAAELHVVRWHAARHEVTIAAPVEEEEEATDSVDDGTANDGTASADHNAPLAGLPATPPPPVRRVQLINDPQRYAVSMAEVAAVVTPHPTPSVLPSDVTDSPMAFLSEYLFVAERHAAANHRPPLVAYMEAAGEGETADTAPTSIEAAVAYPEPSSDGLGFLHHVDLATETFDAAVRGGHRWLRAFAWRRREFLQRPGHSLPRAFVSMITRNDLNLYLGAYGILASLLITRPVLFLAPFLEPAFNTNVSTVSYACLGVRVVCWVLLALLSPLLYRTVSRMAAFGVVVGPEADPSTAEGTVSGALLRAGRCIAAAYDPHLPTVLRGSVPHGVVSHVVVGDVIVAFMPPEALG